MYQNRRQPQGDATTFYVPNLNSDSLPVKLISQVDGEIVTISGTQGDLETISSTVGAGVDNLRLSLPRGQNVIVDLEIADTPYYLILVDRETGELYSANGNGFGGSTKKDRVCMEFVAFDAEPQYCQSFIEGLNDLTYGIRPTNVYVSTYSGSVEGYLDTESDGTYSIGQVSRLSIKLILVWGPLLRRVKQPRFVFKSRNKLPSHVCSGGPG